MSQENVEVVQRVYEGYWDRHDRTIYGPLLHPDVELVRASVAPDPTMRRGVTELERWNAEWETALEGFHMRPERFRSAGDHVVVVGTSTGTVPGTDTEMHEGFWAVWTVKDRLVTRIEACGSEREALQAAGLSE